MEEAELASKFGASYARYLSDVPRRLFPVHPVRMVLDFAAEVGKRQLEVDGGVPSL